jgi:hypothetical protein
MATVTCDVCGGTFNQSYLASHKRLAHGKSKASATSQAGEEETIQTIVFLYGRLSARGRTRVVGLLTEKGKKSK